MSTRSITAVPYIVILDAAPSTVRALLFDCEARVVEGFGARLPHREGAAEDCLEEVERQARESGFHVASVVGRDCPISDLARLCLGTGCLGPKRFALTIGEISALATMQGEAALGEIVPDAAAAYPAAKRALGITGSIEARLETAADDDPGIAPLRDVVRRFREIYDGLSTQLGTPEEIVISGAALLKSPAWTQMIANGLARPVVVCTESDPFARGAALWALKQAGVIGEFSDSPASIGAVFLPQEHFQKDLLQKKVQTTQ